MTLQDLLTTKFNISVQDENVGPTVAITTAVTQIAKNNPGAIAIVIINIGSDDCYIWTTNDVSSSKGMLIAASGGSLFLTYEQYFTLVSSEWYAVAKTNSTTIAIKRLEIS